MRSETWFHISTLYICVWFCLFVLNTILLGTQSLGLSYELLVVSNVIVAQDWYQVYIIHKHSALSGNLLCFNMCTSWCIYCLKRSQWSFIWFCLACSQAVEIMTVYFELKLPYFALLNIKKNKCFMIND